VDLSNPDKTIVVQIVKVKFAGLESGCNGVIFIRMRKESGRPSPSELVEYIMNKAASTGKHMSRFILRVLPVELTCYASVEEITRAAKSLIEQHFPSGEDHPPIKFAVLYEARANSGIVRTNIIDTVAKLVPQGHKVDLSNPDKTIVVQIVKTICMIGVVHKFKQLLKYNLRQLTSVKKS
jgi:tRNA acetyltransferase TAN1